MLRVTTYFLGKDHFNKSGRTSNGKRKEIPFS